jgi:hypothetical protein
MSDRHTQLSGRAKFDFTLCSEASGLLGIGKIMLTHPSNILRMYETREGTSIGTTLSIRHREIGVFIVHKRGLE